MKLTILLSLLPLSLSIQALASDCSSPKERDPVALAMVQSMIEASRLPSPRELAVTGGNIIGENARVFVSARYGGFQDLYAVKLRRAGCRVLETRNFAENVEVRP